MMRTTECWNPTHLSLPSSHTRINSKVPSFMELEPLKTLATSRLQTRKLSAPARYTLWAALEFPLCFSVIAMRALLLPRLVKTILTICHNKNKKYNSVWPPRPQGIHNSNPIFFCKAAWRTFQTAHKKLKWLLFDWLNYVDWSTEMLNKLHYRM